MAISDVILVGFNELGINNCLIKIMILFFFKFKKLSWLLSSSKLVSFESISGIWSLFKKSVEISRLSVSSKVLYLKFFFNLNKNFN